MQTRGEEDVQTAVIQDLCERFTFVIFRCDCKHSWPNAFLYPELCLLMLVLFLSTCIGPRTYTHPLWRNRHEINDNADNHEGVMPIFNPFQSDDTSTVFIFFCLTEQGLGFISLVMIIGMLADDKAERTNLLLCCIEAPLVGCILLHNLHLASWAELNLYAVINIMCAGKSMRFDMRGHDWSMPIERRMMLHSLPSRLA